jgi:RNA polymerase sigma-70 factor (ECF subfamily)
MTRTDEELVAAATAGDLESFNELVSRWERPIFALAFRTLGREEEARDVVQEAFLRAYRGLRAFKGEAKFSSWLYRITLNLCRDWMRRQRRTPVVAVPEGVDPLEVADREAAPAEHREDEALSGVVGVAPPAGTPAGRGSGAQTRHVGKHVVGERNHV